MDRKVLILANVGSRDVLLDGQPLKPARDAGGELLERYEEVKDRIELPIISAGLRHVESLGRRYPEVLGRNERTPQIGLFCTDQRDPDYRESDTVELAEVARRRLPALFPARRENKGLRIRVGKKSVRTFSISRNPARYDHMYSFFEEFFSSDSHLRSPEEWLCFVLASGGTPAMSSMLLLHAIGHFGANCVQVYVAPGQGAANMIAGEHIARAAARRRFNEALEALQFRAAAAIAEDALVGGGWRAAAARYAEHRLAFDFEGAREHCLKALRQADEAEERELLERHAADIESLEIGAARREHQPLLIAEVLYNMEVKHDCGEFVDVLGRAFRLQEALLTWLVETNTSVRTGRRKVLISERGPDQEDAVRAVPGLYEFLTEYRTQEGGRLQLQREINRTALLAVAKHLSRAEAAFPEKVSRRAARVVEAAEGIEQLAKLRNETIIAHGFRGISEEELNSEYGGADLVGDLRESVGAALDKELFPNPFLELSRMLRF